MNLEVRKFRKVAQCPTVGDRWQGGLVVETSYGCLPLRVKTPGPVPHIHQLPQLWQVPCLVSLCLGCVPHRHINHTLGMQDEAYKKQFGRFEEEEKQREQQKKKLFGLF